MSVPDWIQIFVLIILLFLLSPVIGSYMAQVFQGQSTWIHPGLKWLETITYRIGGINPAVQMHWKVYAKTMVLFNLCGFLALFLLQIFQSHLPLNPGSFHSIPWLSAFNTASSFVTNTDWESYAAETTMSYGIQMFGLTVQNFLSAATGLSVAVALIRSIKNQNSESIGNFWVDMVRSVVYLLLPLSLIFAFFLTTQGVVQSFTSTVDIETVEGAKQTLPLGPAASQIAIKQLGSNGGGYFKANSAHPFENPNGLTNFFELLTILLIPASMTFFYGTVFNSRKHGWLLFLVMLLLWLIGLAIALCSEYLHNPVLEAYPVMEGKETRFGIASSILWTVSTTATANGSFNAIFTSLSPLAGGVAMFNIMLGEVIFGGVGTGLCFMLMFVIFTVFLSGLLVGRTPEYMGKKIETKEMQWVIIAIIASGAMILVGSGISCLLPSAFEGIGNQGPHGLTSLIYAFASAAGNNGSRFSGLEVNNHYFNLSIGIIMIIARVAILIPSLAVAGYLGQKRNALYSQGTFSTDTLLFAALLIAIILIFGILTFFPAFSLGPLVEHLLMLKGKAF